MSQSHSCCQGLPCTTARPALTVIAGAVLLGLGIISYFTLPTQPWLFASLAIAATLVAGAPVAAAGFRAARRGRFDMNLLIVIAATGAIAINEYFEAATAMVLFAVSLWLEKVSIARANRAVQTLLELAPNVAHRLSSGDETNFDLTSLDDIHPNQLQPGNIVLVRPGERVPADGVVLRGESSIDQSPITGESVPVEKTAGDNLFAGTLNGESALFVRVTQVAAESTLARIGRLIESARKSRSLTERFIDAFARRYTPAVIVLSIALMTVPPLLSHFGVFSTGSATTTDWIYRGLVLLVIACPCALVISTPVTVVSALHAAARGGILVKGGEPLERASNIRRLAIDKTGTLTTGKMALAGIESFNGFAADNALAIAAGLERHSEHPLAAALTAAADQRGVTSLEAESVSALRGLGVRGQVAGENFFLGNARLFEAAEFSLSARDREQFQVSQNTGTIAFLGTGRQLLARFELTDQPRPGTREALLELKSLGVEQIAMLTGDRAAAAEQIAREVGIDEVHADLLPQDKIARVQALREDNRVLAMIGDGVNDAPALAAADLGIALGGTASATTLETADVVIMSPEMGKVAQLMRISGRMKSLLKQNIAFALGTKLLVISLAAFGLATMWMAVAADVGASMLVVANGMRALSRIDT